MAAGTHTVPARRFRATCALPDHATQVVFPAMGTQVHLALVDAPPGLIEGARAHVERLEQRWSRFRPDSDLSRLARSDGGWLDVHPDTVVLLERARVGWELTDGRFDPTVLSAVVAAGYDRTFADVVDRPAPDRRRAGPDDAARPANDSTPEAAPGLAGLELDPGTHRVRLPAGVGVDPGAIGKGLAADLVAERLLSCGAAGAMVNVGGDLRVTGQAPDPAGWGIEVVVPGRDTTVVVALAEGAVATSTPAYRRWRRAGRTVHHLVDPRTGRPAARPAASATVVAGAGWLAEVLATSLVLGGPRDQLAPLGATGLVVADDGSLDALSGLEEYRR